jgi:hypothetical protein
MPDTKGTTPMKSTLNKIRSLLGLSNSSRGKQQIKRRNRQFLLEGLERREVFAAVSFAGGTYLQDFQSMTDSNLAAGIIATTTMHEVAALGGGGSVSGWYAYGTSASPRWGRDNGASGTGGFYAMRDGTTALALGSQGSGNNIGFFGVVLKNTSGSVINDVSFSYDAFMVRNPSTTVNPYPLSFLVSSTDVATGSVTGAGTFNNGAGTWNSIATGGFTTPSSGTGSPSTTQGAINPMFKIGSTINVSLTGIAWGIDQFLYFRWTEADNSGSDSTAGVDNFSFTATVGDTTPPTLVSTSPVDNATGVLVNSNLVATFSESVVKGTGNIEIRRTTDNSLFQSIDVTSAAVTVSGAAVTIDPNTLDVATEYYVLIPAGTIKDPSNNNYAGLTSTTAWSFTTQTSVDNTPPAIVSLNPLDNATSVPVADNLVVTFDEPVAKVAGNVVIRRTSDNSLVETINVTSAAVTVSGNAVTINPAANLPFGTDVYVLIDAGAIEDVAGNDFGGISATTAWNFATVTNQAPSISLNRTITLHPDQLIAIGANILNVVDPEGGAITYTVDSISTEGELRNGTTVLGVGSTFTQANVAAEGSGGTIRFKSTGTTPASTTISLTAADSAGATTPVVLTINIVAVPDPISYSTGTYSQNFDNLLPTSPIAADAQTLPSAMVLPAGWRILETGTNENSSLRVDRGSSSTGDSYAFGAAIRNTSAATLSSFSLSYFGERWRFTNNAAGDRLDFSFKIDATGLNDTGFVDADSFDYVIAGSTTGSDGPIDGNDSANRTSISSSVTGLTWAPNSVLWIRWSDSNTAGNDSSLGVDDVQFSATASLANPSISLTAPNAVYTSSPYAGASAIVSGASAPIPSPVFTYFVGAGTSGENLGANAPINVGTYTVVASTLANSANNAATSAPVTFQITPASLTATASASNKVYDGNTSAIVSIALAGILGSDVVTGTASGTFDTKNVGTGKVVTVGSVTLAGASAANYTVGSAANTTADITAKALTASATAANKVYDGNTSAVVTVTLGGIVSGDTVSGSATGTFNTKDIGVAKPVTVGTVTLAGADATNYTVGAAANTSADITAKALTATGTASNKTYNGNTVAVVSITLAGIIGSEVVTGSASGTFNNKNVGTAKPVTIGTITLAGADAGNYTVGTAPATTASIFVRTINASVTGVNKVYDGNANATLNVTLSGTISGDDVAATGTGTFDNKNVGIAKPINVDSVVLTGVDAPNYEISTFAPTTSANVTRKALTASASAANKVYDGNTSATITITLGGVVSGDAVSGSATGAFNNKNIGTAKPVTVGVVTLAGADAGNYTVGTAANTSADITPKSLTSSATASNKVYDGNTSAVVTVSLAGVVSGDVVTGSATGTFDNKNVGTGKTVTVGTVILAGADAANYTAGSAPNTTASITAKALTATATAASKVYDGNTSAVVTVTLGGVVSGDTVNGSATGTFDNENVGTGKTVTVGTVTLAGTDAGNYTVGAAPNTTADITAKALTATASAANKIYDGNTSASVTISLVGIVSGDVVSGLATGTFNDKNVGTAKAVTVGTVTLVGADAGNYSVGAAANASADITPKSLTSSATASSKVYDGNTSAVVAVSLAGVVSGDVVTGSATGTFDNKNVGTGKTVTVGTVTLVGADAGNYTAGTAPNTTASITAMALTASATAANKIYDGNTTAVVAITLGGVVSGDAVSGSTTGTFDTKNVGTAKPVTVGAVVLAGADAGNYSVGTAANPTADIQPRVLTSTATAANKVYDGNTSAVVTIGLTGIVSGDTVAGSASGSFADKNVGTAKTVTVGTVTLAGTDASNYTAGAAANTTADITPKTLVGTITVLNKVFDGNTSATIGTRSLSGIVSGDSVSYVGGTAVFPSSSVGTYTVPATGLSLSGADAGNYSVNTTASATASITPLTGPTVLSVGMNAGDTYLNANQRSQLTNVAITFSTAVTLQSGALRIFNANTNVEVTSLIVTPNSTASQFTIRFASGTGVQTRPFGNGNSLVDGNYKLVVDATKVAAGSTNMAANFEFGTAATDKFFRLFGDSDGDGDVDGTDTISFRRSFLGLEYNAAMDFDGDGVVLNDAQDLAGYSANRNKVRNPLP